MRLYKVQVKKFLTILYSPNADHSLVLLTDACTVSGKWLPNYSKVNKALFMKLARNANSQHLCTTAWLCKLHSCKMSLKAIQRCFQRRREFRWGMFLCAEEDWGSPIWFHWCIICTVSHKRMEDSYCVVFKSFPSPPVITEAADSPGRGLLCVIYMQFVWAEFDRREVHTDALFTAEPFFLDASPCSTCDDLKCQ